MSLWLDFGFAGSLLLMAAFFMFVFFEVTSGQFEFMKRFMAFLYLLGASVFVYLLGPIGLLFVLVLLYQATFSDAK